MSVASPAVSPAAFASDVQYYLALQPRQLPSRYFYDALGSALFEAICSLPWYSITRAELRLLTAHGREILSRVPRLSTLVELGPGSGEKLTTLVEAGRVGSSPLQLHLIDVSPTALAVAVRSLTSLHNVEIDLHEAPYEVGLAEVTARPAADGRTLALFLGSNLGNFDRPGADAFLHGIRAALRGGDALLLGADLVKPGSELLLAYDDPLGVTAAFNRNLLVRINRELGGTFDLEQFAHRAVWNAEQSRVEMHLVSQRRQDVRVAAADLAFTIEEGESIWTESSYKYEPAAIVEILRTAGFRLMNQWIDRGDGFALTLVEAI
ncbi:MAG TPA: L-histidine N(alpha)-methyltransferase [Vicinamibacterales bacterium]|nr:L-histidine N(alpha)-methyltransferase [Vicinamibacterales bacterium]